MGAFSLQLNEVLADSDRWRPGVASAVAGTMSTYAQTWATSYTRVTGHLQLSMTGLPAGTRRRCGWRARAARAHGHA
jgi:hypothetical protein